MADFIDYSVQVNLPKTLPNDIEPHVHVFDVHGKYLTSAAVSATGTGRVQVRLPQELVGSALRIAVAPVADAESSLRALRRTNAVERVVPFDPDSQLVFDIPDFQIANWVLGLCVVVGRVVKAVPQPSGVAVNYPVCNARVHICEVDKVPRIVFRIPDDLIVRVRDELLVEPPPPPDLLKRNRIGTLPRQSAAVASGGDQNRAGVSTLKAAAPAEMTRLVRATNTVEIRRALVDLSAYFPWFCWFPWLDPFWHYEVDCLSETMTDTNGKFFRIIGYPPSDKPDIYIWVEQFIAGSWKTIYARGPRCDTHWDYQCGTEITIHVTDPDAIVCVPPPEVVVPDGITSWVLPMAVGDLEIAGQAGDPGELGWVQPDGTASYSGAPANVNPVTDAPLGGLLQFRMLHSLDFPKAGMGRYSWSYRPKPNPDPMIAGGWTKMDETITRRYQIPGPNGLPLFPVHALGPDEDELFAFRPHTPPAGVWPVSGFIEDLWSAKLDTAPMASGLYQVRVTVHDGTGAVVAPSASTFRFVATDTRVAGETYSARAAFPSEIIDDGFVFDMLIDNAPCVAVLHPVQTSLGAVADTCGFLNYADKNTTDITFSFEASHARDHGWFTLEMVRGLTGLPQVEVMDGGEVGALTVPVDSNSGGVWPNAHYTGDGDGNFDGVFSAVRFLEDCDNGAFAADLYARAKAHNGSRRLYEYDAHALMGFALAQELPTT